MAVVAKSRRALSYAEDFAGGTRYRKLQQSGLTLNIALANSSDVVTLTGVNPQTCIQELRCLIYNAAGIHPSKQRIYLGGDEIEPDKNLLKYFATVHDVNARCSLQIRSFIPLLISTQSCPGPLLTEIEVSPLNNEPVAEIKRRIRDKFRIEVNLQRLHLHPAAMTTYSRRRPLDDARLLSFYLDPGAGDNFLELVVMKDTKSTKLMFVKVPLQVLTSSQFGKNDQAEINANLTNQHSDEETTRALPPTPPQTPASESSKLEQYIEQISNKPRYENWWITLPVNYDSILKRDPTVKDLTSCLWSFLQSQPLLQGKDYEGVSLKFADVRSLFGGKKLSTDALIYDSFCVRSEEMLTYIDDVALADRIKSPPLGDISIACEPKPMEPLKPLLSYNEETNRYTMPFDPFTFVWDIPASQPIDCGARPKTTFEISAVSYCRAYGSWDIPEHHKTYVEIDVEGTSEVGDLGLEAVLGLDTSQCLGQDHDLDAVHDLSQREAFRDYNGKRKVVYYVHDNFEVTILGPVNAEKGFSQRRPSEPYMGEATRNWSFDRRRHAAELQQLRRSQYGNPKLPNPPPFRIKPHENCVQQSSEVDNPPINPSWDSSRNLNKTAIGEWYLGRERVTDVSLPGLRSKQSPVSAHNVSAFTTSCKRGISIEGRPYLTVDYRRQLAITTTTNMLKPTSNLVDSIRKALDFRIQVQFFICTLLADQPDLSASSTAPFTVRVRHQVSRIEHLNNLADHVTKFESPAVGMETTLSVALATPDWRKSKGLPQTVTEDLNR